MMLSRMPATDAQTTVAVVRQVCGNGVVRWGQADCPSEVAGLSYKIEARSTLSSLRWARLNAHCSSMHMTMPSCEAVDLPFDRKTASSTRTIQRRSCVCPVCRLRNELQCSMQEGHVRFHFEPIRCKCRRSITFICEVPPTMAHERILNRQPRCKRKKPVMPPNVARSSSPKLVALR